MAQGTCLSRNTALAKSTLPVPEGTGPTVMRMANLGSEFSGPSEDPYHSEQSKCLIVPPRSP